MGFMPLSGRNDPSDSMGEGDIPLRPVQTAGSTGARRQNQTLDDMDLEQTSSAEEKKTGLFHRKSKNEAANPAGRRKNVKALGEGGRKGTYGEENGLNAMGRIYNKIIGFSVVTRYLVYIAPVALVLAVPLIVIPITGHYEDTRVGGTRESNAPRLFDLFLWIEISWLALWGGKIVAHFFPPIFSKWPLNTSTVSFLFVWFGLFWRRHVCHTRLSHYLSRSSSLGWSFEAGRWQMVPS